MSGRPGPVDGLHLRPLRLGDEAAFRTAHEVMVAEQFTFGLGYQPGQSWPAYLEELSAQRRGIVPDGGLVPATFLVADVDGQIVGRSSVRHELNDFLAHEGGHIGYGVLPPYRRRGYATEILRQSLAVAWDVGVDHALVTCEDSNVGSATVIERCGGVFESLVVSRDGRPTRRYWISRRPRRAGRDEP